MCTFKEMLFDDTPGIFIKDITKQTDDCELARVKLVAIQQVSVENEQFDLIR